MDQNLMGQASMGLEDLVKETFARLGAPRPERLAEDDYRSFSDALGASERGRAFLHEYARRNRHADTEVVLAALARLEQTARAHQPEPEAERVRQDLRALLETLRGAKPQIDSSPGAIKAATLSAMLEFVQARLEALITPRTTLEQVPVPEQPELPIPQPSPMPTVLALVHAAMAAPPPPARSPLDIVETENKATALKAEAAAPTRLNQVIPEVSFFDGTAAPAPVKAQAEAAPPIARAPIPAAEPAMPAIVADAPVAAQKPLEKPIAKAAVEPYELWLDPGLAETPKQESAQTNAQDNPQDKAKAKEPTLVLPPQDQSIAAQVDADLMAPVEAVAPLPAAAAAPSPPSAAKPTTALAALAATFIKTENSVPAPASASPAPPPVLHYAAPTTMAAVAAKPAPAAKTTALNTDDPLALIMALSESERLALFT